MKEVSIYTDGACSGNPGPGGWGAILVCQGHEKALQGGEMQTTNNRMELTAVIEALSCLKEPCRVTITSDSTYVVHSVTKGWLDGWVRKNWKKSSREEVPNKELWQRLLLAMKPHEISWVWVRGHNGHPFNERCDRLAVAYTEKIREEQSR